MSPTTITRIDRIARADWRWRSPNDASLPETVWVSAQKAG